MFTDDIIEGYPQEPYSKYYYEISIHGDIVLIDAQIDCIKEHEKLGNDRQWKELPKELDEDIFIPQKMSEYIHHISKNRKCYNHPGNLPLWPVREVHEYLDTIRIEDQKVDIDEWNPYIFDKECEEFILGYLALGESFFFRYMCQGKKRTKKSTGKYHPVHENLAFIEHI